MPASWIKRWFSIRILGPVFRHDLVRGTRRGRLVLVRVLYAGCLLAAVLAAPVAWFLNEQRTWTELFWLKFTSREEAAGLTSGFFYGFLAVQWLMAFLLTPAYVAGVLTEEKERRTLEFLLATDLRNREIIFGILASRLAHLLLLMLTGLPVLCLLFLLGGVVPEVLLAGFAAAGLTMFSVGGVSMWHSVYARKPWAAVLRTYLTIVLFLAVTGSAWYLVVALPKLGSWPSTDDWTSPVTLDDVAGWLNIGNLPAVVGQVVQDMDIGLSLYAVLPRYLLRFAMFHLAIGFGTCAWAALAVRRRARREADGPRKKERIPNLRPPMLGWPLLWKEWFLERGRRRGWLRKLGAAVVLALVFWPAVHIFYFYGRVTSAGPKDTLSEFINTWLAVLAAGMGYYMLLQVVVRAAGSFSGERRRQTLDLLLIAPLTNRSILWSKWLGSLGAGRWLWLWLAVALGLGVVAGGMPLWAALLWLGVWWLCAWCFAGLGLWFSLKSRSSIRAAFATLVTIAVILCMFWACSHPFDIWGLDKIEEWGFLPPALLYLLPLATETLVKGSQNWQDIQRFGLIVVLGLWLMGGVVLYWAVDVRFRRLTGRKADARPSWFGGLDRSGWREGLGAWRRWGRRRLAAALPVVVPLAVISAGYFVFHLIDEKEFRDMVAATDRLDPHWRLEDLEAERVRVPDDQNAALQVQKVKDLVPMDAYSKAPDLRAISLDLDPPQRLKDAQVRDLDAFLKKWELGVAQARCLADLPRGHQPIAWSEDGWSTPLESIQSVREITNLLSYEAIWQAERSTGDGALVSCRGILNAGRSREEVMLVELLVRFAVTVVCLGRTERALAQTSPSESTLVSLQGLLEDEEKRRSLWIATRWERALNFRFLDFGQRQGFRLTPFFSPRDWRAYLRSLNHQRADLLDYHNRMIEITCLPVEQQEDKFIQLEKTVPQRSRLIRELAPAMSKVSEANRRVKAMLRCGIVMVALERYRIRNNRWPSSLTELVPTFVEQVPVDLYDGQFVRFRRLSDGVMVYCVGPDKQDNGGKLDRKNPIAPGSDLGFRLWDVEKRRQAPPK